MRALLSTIGSRGDVQPLVALARELAALGAEVRVCAPPDFRELVDDLGIPFVPIGPELRGTASSSAPAPASPPSPEVLRQMAEGTVAAQFATLPAAAEGCDVVVGCGSLQIAARSVAEAMAIPYVFAAYCPITLPSSHHAPPPMAVQGPVPAVDAVDNATLWARDARHLNEMFGRALDSHRAAAGLPPVADVRSHIITDAPWLAADQTLAPWPGSGSLDVVQTGAWILPDERRLAPELEAFLEAGEPPVYFGFGSMRAPGELATTALGAARAHGRRAILVRGWGDLFVEDDELDCISITEVNHQALLPQVAAVVHHGGAGTTTVAALAGAPQVVIPQMYDQHYFAGRVERLGIGTAHPPVAPTTDSLTAVLGRALAPDVAACARSIAGAVRTDGARIAAQRLVGEGRSGA